MDNLTIGFYTVLTDVIERLKQAGCKVVNFGDSDSYARDKNLVTPAASISPSSFNPLSGKISSIGLEIFIYGQLAFHKVNTDQDPKYGEKNEVDVMSESMAIASKFISPMIDRTLEIDGDNGGYLKLQSSVQFTPVTAQGNDSVSGIIGTAVFEFTSFNSSCG